MKCQLTYSGKTADTYAMRNAMILSRDKLRVHRGLVKAYETNKVHETFEQEYSKAGKRSSKLVICPDSSEER